MSSTSELDDFLERLSSGEPVPGGGSAAALEAAMAAALLAMVANLTLGRKRFADVQQEAEQLRDRALALRRRSQALAGDDEAAYGAVSQAMALPRETDEDKAIRRERVQSALKEAARPPLEVMRVSADILALAARVAEIGNPSAISDVGTAALSARAAWHGARLNVEINAAAVRDEHWVSQLREEMAAIPVPDRDESTLLERVLRHIRGER